MARGNITLIFLQQNYMTMHNKCNKGYKYPHVSLDQSMPPKKWVYVRLRFATKYVIFKIYVVKDFGISELQIWYCRLVQELELFY